MADVALVVAVLALASVLGAAWRARNGRFRPADVARPADPAGPAVGGPGTPAVDVLGAADVGAPLGDRATFVQLSSEVCAACRSTRVALAGVAADEPGVVHVELDVAEHLDLVRRLGVMRTPTTLVLGPRGRIVGRMSGATDRRQALAALESCPAPESCPGAAAA
ncbi:thioredoxin family protein [Cellulomonas sp. KH9]|uniref:TlpA family protein disulfide reductase n=1 Tax=Cellulomonas sp. KH9 TaxID=1855324 RepID=UPI0008EF8000|nr:thioredoxin family protein [Cellulomonas sp. KH9]SFJ68215.1 hypothetical protein SAMN05216467_0476 [Cellulomonas sp. KH9]